MEYSYPRLWSQWGRRTQQAVVLDGLVNQHIPAIEACSTHIVLV
jgi:hypothetical protein